MIGATVQPREPLSEIEDTEPCSRNATPVGRMMHIPVHGTMVTIGGTV